MPEERPLLYGNRNVTPDGGDSEWLNQAILTRAGTQGKGALSVLWPVPGKGTLPPRLTALANDLLLIHFAMAGRKRMGGAALLQKSLLHHLNRFEKKGQAWGKSAEDIALAKFALVALLDETIRKSESDCTDAWRDQPLQSILYGEVLAGEKFFAGLETLMADPEGRWECLELHYLCLIAGFRGKYLHDTGRQIDKIILDTREILQSSREAPATLSPSAYVRPGKPPRARGNRRWVVAASILAAALVILYAALIPVADLPLAGARSETGRLLNPDKGPAR